MLGRLNLLGFRAGYGGWICGVSFEPMGGVWRRGPPKALLYFVIPDNSSVTLFASYQRHGHEAIAPAEDIPEIIKQIEKETR